LNEGSDGAGGLRGRVLILPFVMEMEIAVLAPPGASIDVGAGGGGGTSFGSGGPASG